MFLYGSSRSEALFGGDIYLLQFLITFLRKSLWVVRTMYLGTVLRKWIGVLQWRMGSGVSGMVQFAAIWRAAAAFWLTGRTI